MQIADEGLVPIARRVQEFKTRASRSARPEGILKEKSPGRCGLGMESILKEFSKDEINSQWGFKKQRSRGKSWNNGRRQIHITRKISLPRGERTGKSQTRRSSRAKGERGIAHSTLQDSNCKTIVDYFLVGVGGKLWSIFERVGGQLIVVRG